MRLGGAEVDCTAPHPTSSSLPLFLSSSLHRRYSNVDEAGHLHGVRGGSGGYADCIFRHAAQALFGVTVEEPLQWKTLRNADFKEISLEVRLQRNITGCIGQHISALS